MITDDKYECTTINTSEEIKTMLHIVPFIYDIIMPPFEEGGAYCVAHVGRYVGIP